MQTRQAIRQAADQTTIILEWNEIHYPAWWTWAHVAQGAATTTDGKISGPLSAQQQRAEIIAGGALRILGHEMDSDIMMDVYARDTDCGGQAGALAILRRVLG